MIRAYCESLAGIGKLRPLYKFSNKKGTASSNRYALNLKSRIIVLRVNKRQRFTVEYSTLFDRLACLTAIRAEPRYSDCAQLSWTAPFLLPPPGRVVWMSAKICQGQWPCHQYLAFTESASINQHCNKDPISGLTL